VRGGIDGTAFGVNENVSPKLRHQRGHSEMFCARQQRFLVEPAGRGSATDSSVEAVGHPSSPVVRV
jgi:hypothetical protein